MSDSKRSWTRFISWVYDPKDVTTFGNTLLVSLVVVTLSVLFSSAAIDILGTPQTVIAQEPSPEQKLEVKGPSTGEPHRIIEFQVSGVPGPYIVDFLATRQDQRNKLSVDYRTTLPAKAGDVTIVYATAPPGDYLLRVWAVGTTEPRSVFQSNTTFSIVGELPPDPPGPGPKPPVPPSDTKILPPAEGIVVVVIESSTQTVQQGKLINSRKIKDYFAEPKRAIMFVDPDIKDATGNVPPAIADIIAHAKPNIPCYVVKNLTSGKIVASGSLTSEVTEDSFLGLMKTIFE